MDNLTEGTPGYGGSPGLDGSPSFQLATTVRAAAPGVEVTKVIVAVHGIGDQHSYATIQSVVNQFCKFYHQPAAIPLGTFHTGQPALSIQAPYPTEPFARFAFAEVYWAEIPRLVASEQHTLEEAQQWARTIVERLRLRWRGAGMKGGCREADFRLLSQVLTEMIQTIAVVDRICYLADKAGLFTFDLRKLLDDFLGDVQIVTEFETQRGQILKKFSDVMDGVHQSFPAAEIYLVAHSEGTVVTLLGLLKAWREKPTPGWATRVRGLMTLGSPIDKHLVLWPELFGDGPPAQAATQKIEWRNYYDRGDPVGFALDDARAWIRIRQWEGVFNFSDGHDFGFTRYPFPGKAHVDYWTDEAVFGHFFTTVVNRDSSQQSGTRAAEFVEPPRDIRRMQWISYLLPYLGVTALLVVAAYLLFKAVSGAIDPNDLALRSNQVIAKGVAGIAGLLLGITVVARIPRLTRSLFWRGASIGIGLLLAGVYLWSVSGGNPKTVLGVSVPAGWITLALAVTLVGVVYVLGAVFPAWGLKPLMLLGTLAVVGTVGTYLWRAKSVGDLGPIWPVVLATIGFLYLWWLGALLFDLVFVWHLYIRHSRMLERMHEIVGGSPDRSRTDGSRHAAPATAAAAQRRS